MGKIKRVALSEVFCKLDAEKVEHGERNDCAVKAVALATGKTYKQSLDALLKAGRKPGVEPGRPPSLQ